MTRFITMQSENGMIQAFAENENKIDEWQNDDSKETY